MESTYPMPKSPEQGTSGNVAEAQSPISTPRPRTISYLHRAQSYAPVIPLELVDEMQEEIVEMRKAMKAQSKEIEALRTENDMLKGGRAAVSSAAKSFKDLLEATHCTEDIINKEMEDLKEMSAESKAESVIVREMEELRKVLEGAKLESVIMKQIEEMREGVLEVYEARIEGWERELKEVLTQKEQEI